MESDRKTGNGPITSHENYRHVRTNHNKNEHSEWMTAENLGQDAIEVELCAHQVDLVNIYVSLKSKPLLLIFNVNKQEKIDLLDYLATALTGGNVFQYQTSLGHPWWANHNPNLEFFVETQQRFITERLVDMIEDAWQPQNSKKIYIAYLEQISPAELMEFFREVACQLNHGQITQIGDVHFSEPVPFPPNLFIVGTMDAGHFDYCETDLFRKTTLVHLPPRAERVTLSSSRYPNTGIEGAVFLDSSIRTEDDACRKLHSILGHEKNTEYKKPLYPLFQVENLLIRYGLKMPSDWLEDVLLYLSNSWTKAGNGLFNCSTKRNLSIAMDFAIAQSLLPYAKERLKVIEELGQRLRHVLKGRFPYSMAYVDWLAGSALENA